MSIFNPCKGLTINDLGGGGAAEEKLEMNLFFPRDSLSKKFSWRRAFKIYYLARGVSSLEPDPGKAVVTGTVTANIYLCLNYFAIF